MRKKKEVSILDLYNSISSNMFELFLRFRDAGVNEHDLYELYDNMTNLIDMYIYLLREKNKKIDQKER